MRMVAGQGFASANGKTRMPSLARPPGFVYSRGLARVARLGQIQASGLVMRLLRQESRRLRTRITNAYAGFMRSTPNASESVCCASVSARPPDEQPERDQRPNRHDDGHHRIDNPPAHLLCLGWTAKRARGGRGGRLLVVSKMTTLGSKPLGRSPSHRCVCSSAMLGSARCVILLAHVQIYFVELARRVDCALLGLIPTVHEDRYSTILPVHFGSSRSCSVRGASGL
jgi:hypothetical protein